jgi:hypothetical protein
MRSAGCTSARNWIPAVPSRTVEATGRRRGMTDPMSDIDPAQVRELAAGLGLALAGDDLTEVTHRLNAFLHVLAPLHDLGLTEADPGSVTTPGSIVPGPPACGQKDAADA